jgi:hypothetical protein
MQCPGRPFDASQFLAHSSANEKIPMIRAPVTPSNPATALAAGFHFFLFHGTS